MRTLRVEDLYHATACFQTESMIDCSFRNFSLFEYLIFSVPSGLGLNFDIFALSIMTFWNCLMGVPVLRPHSFITFLVLRSGYRKSCALILVGSTLSTSIMNLRNKAIIFGSELVNSMA